MKKISIIFLFFLFSCSSNTIFVGEYHGNGEWEKGILTHKRTGDKFEGEWDENGKIINGKGKLHIRPYVLDIKSWKEGIVSAKWTLINEKMKNHRNYIYDFKGNKTRFQYFFGESEGLSNWSNGIIRYERGAYYKGQFKDHYMHGEGILEFPYLKQKYEGEWVKGSRHGQGTMEWSNGEKYVGQWVKGKEHGQGFMNWPDARKYEGGWRGGKKYGKGSQTNQNGKKEIGFWENDNLIVGTILFANGDEFKGENRYTKIGIMKYYGSKEIRMGEFKYDFTFKKDWTQEALQTYIENKYPSFKTLLTSDVEYPKPITDNDEKKLISTGSGFLISNNGIIVTNHHVVDNSKNIKAYFPSHKKTYSCKILIEGKDDDIAILRLDNFKYSDISNKPIPYSIGNRKSIDLGKKVYTLGYPLSDILGDDIKISDGLITSKSGINNDYSRMQIDNPIQPGNSGGPLFNHDGELVGIIVSSYSQQHSIRNTGTVHQNVNFAIKINRLINLIEELDDADMILDRKNSLIGYDLSEQIDRLKPITVQMRTF